MKIVNVDYISSFFKIALVVLLLHSKIVKCDLPVHCKREAIDGIWTFRINSVIFNPSLKNPETHCGHGFPDRIENTVGDIDFSFERFRDIKIRLGSDYKVYSVNTKEQVVGSWTPVYDEGFILKYKSSVFTAFMKYYKAYSSSTDYISNCDKTMIGWYIPDEKENTVNWSCFYGFKNITKKAPSKSSFLAQSDKFSESNQPKAIQNNSQNIGQKLSDFMSLKEKVELTTNSLLDNENMLDSNKIKYEDQQEVVNEINSMNLSWKANVHKEFKGLSLLELSHKLGLKRKKSMLNTTPSSTNTFFDSQFTKPAKQINNLKKSNSKTNFFEPSFVEVLNKEMNTGDKDLRREYDSQFVTDISQIQKYLDHDISEMDEKVLAKNWDWRNVGGNSYIPPLKRQGSCGSCYIFSTVSSLEARLRIMTNNKDKTEFSRQFPLSCSFYTEGCEGGYPILVGKFFNEFEIVPDECFEYEAKDIPCSQVCDYSRYPKKYTVKKYEYLGGFYGATSEVEMMKEIRARGPIPGNISVPWSFSYYSNGIYTHEKILKKNAGNISKSTLFDKKISWEKVDHSITLIGWGEENGVKYWIGMNTWGEEWGENGYFRILRGENECSVESMGDSFRIHIQDR